MSIATEILEIIFPAHCVLCNRLPKQICNDCWQSISLKAHEVTRGSLPGFAISEYASAVATLLNAFKERGHRKLGELLAEQLPIQLSRPAVDLIVAAPSSKKNFAARGFVPAVVIARVLGKAWKIPLSQLSLAASIEDQVSLNRAQRFSHLVGAMTARQPLAGKRVLLVDDVVTTGATLIEMARAVAEAGGQPIGFVTIAETFPKVRAKN